MWVGGCVTAPTAWASPPRRRHGSVHKSAEMAPRCRFGAFVYTVATRGSFERPWGRRSVHKWEDRASPRRFGAFVYTVAPREDRASDRGDAGVYTDRPKWPLGAVSGHLCTLLQRESQYESRRELRQVARAPQPPWRAGCASSLAPLAWSGRQALREWRRCQVGILAEASTHTNPRRAR